MRGKRESWRVRTRGRGSRESLKAYLSSPLIILNYHRVGNAAETPFDSGTFSATPEELDSQLPGVGSGMEAFVGSLGASWKGTIYQDLCRK